MASLRALDNQDLRWTTQRYVFRIRDTFKFTIVECTYWEKGTCHFETEIEKGESKRPHFDSESYNERPDSLLASVYCLLSLTQT